ncbi:MAG TPA: NADP-dependent oxidoreductase [Stellaceae bacterium]|nr:NADP-dependent oxidoreductase [Stellaceae bacterium]
MSTERHRRIVLAARPVGEPSESNFRLVEGDVPVPGPGEMLLRTIYLSLDPYMRGRMNEGRSYAKPVELNGVMEAGGVSAVVQSNLASFKPGDIVEGRTGWQSHAVSNGKGVRKIDPEAAPLSTALGVLGMPGMTAYTGLLTIGQPKPGETVAVAAASGAVGQVVGQIAKLKGCRVVGIAGGARKCAYIKDELGFDAAVDHRQPEFAAALGAACPAGIDVYFENVGGAVFAAVLPLLNDFARVPVCGLIAHYNATGAPEGPDRLPGMMRTVLSKRLALRGFIVSDFAAQHGDFLRDVGGWLKAGRIKYREDFVDGIENAPRAFLGLLRGENFGKLIVRVSPDPTRP